MRPIAASWLIAAMAGVITLLIRSRVFRIFEDPALGIGEPWLILDARPGVESILAIFWAGFVVLAPWIANISLVVILTVQIVADSVAYHPFNSLVVGFGIALLFFTGFFASISTVSGLLDLRYLRKTVGHEGSQ